MSNQGGKAQRATSLRSGLHWSCICCIRAQRSEGVVPTRQRVPSRAVSTMVHGPREGGSHGDRDTVTRTTAPPAAGFLVSAASTYVRAARSGLAPDHQIRPRPLPHAATNPSRHDAPCARAANHPTETTGHRTVTANYSWTAPGGRASSWLASLAAAPPRRPWVRGKHANAIRQGKREASLVVWTLADLPE